MAADERSFTQRLNGRGEYQFMSPRERLKVEALKLLCLAVMGWGFHGLIFAQAAMTDRLHDAAMICSASFFYLNLFLVKFKLAEMFAPRQVGKGAGLVLMMAGFAVMSVALELRGG